MSLSLQSLLSRARNLIISVNDVQLDKRLKRDMGGREAIKVNRKHLLVPKSRNPSSIEK